MESFVSNVVQKDLNYFAGEWFRSHQISNYVGKYDIIERRRIKVTVFYTWLDFSINYTVNAKHEFSECKPTASFSWANDRAAFSTAKPNAVVPNHIGLSGLLCSGKLSDFKIESDDKEFNVHKCVLAGKSAYFDRLFDEQCCFQENVLNKLSFKGFTGEVVAEYLKMLYTDNYISEFVDIANAEELYKLCQLTNVNVSKARQSLLNACLVSTELCELLNTFYISILYSDRILKEMLTCHIGIVMQKIMKLNPGLIITDEPFDCLVFYSDFQQYANAHNVLSFLIYDLI